MIIIVKSKYTANGYYYFNDDEDVRVSLENGVDSYGEEIDIEDIDGQPMMVVDFTPIGIFRVKQPTAISFMVDALPPGTAKKSTKRKNRA